MINKVLASIILLSFIAFCISLAGNVYPSELLDHTEQLATLLFLSAGIIFLIKNGTFRYQSTFYWFIASVLLLICGVVFKIMHWQYSFVLIVSACLAMLAFYTIHFIRKPIKANLDWMKLLFAYTYIVSRYTNSFIYTHNYFIHYIAIALFALVFFLFFYKPPTKNPYQVIDE
ncbi:MAG: hypothetical protein K0R51_2000 [Cytophagaceae bacterium]|jgi:hypothetical protein|nr:hypothetical protein [Cytophagaceae bacterium]